MGAAESVDQLRMRALNAGRVLARVGRVAGLSRTTTLNARLAASRLGRAGAAFTVVVHALDETVAELAELVEGLERARARAIRAMAAYTESERVLHLASRCLLEVTDGAAARDRPDAALEPGIARRWEQARADLPPDSLAAALWGALASAREAMLTSLASILTVSDELARLVDAVEVLSSSRGFFVGVNGTIEAVRVGEDGLTQLATELRSLIGEINAAVADAGNEARSLGALARAATVALEHDIALACLAATAGTSREKGGRR